MLNRYNFSSAHTSYAARAGNSAGVLQMALAKNHELTELAPPKRFMWRKFGCLRH